MQLHVAEAEDGGHDVELVVVAGGVMAGVTRRRVDAEQPLHQRVRRFLQHQHSPRSGKR